MIGAAVARRWLAAVCWSMTAWLGSLLLQSCGHGDDPNRPALISHGKARLVCGNLATPCCPGLENCAWGLACGQDGSGQCCAVPLGAACKKTSDCCDNLSCQGGECCAVSGRGCTSSQDCCAGLMCDRGTCQAPPSGCGQAGQQCCGDSNCVHAQSCSGGRCQACGKPGLPCCGKAGSCFGGAACAGPTCFDQFGCGGSGEPCCPAESRFVNPGDRSNALNRGTQGSCREGLVCGAGGFCAAPGGACSAGTCYDCRTMPGCGWCDGQGCLSGTSAGPQGKSCNRWTWNAFECPGESPCQAANAEECAAKPGCGWCGDQYVGDCRSGGATGPSSGYCPASCWSQNQSAPESCQLGLWDRCVELSVNECATNSKCGWCGDPAKGIGLCREGSASGPLQGTCCWTYGSQQGRSPKGCALGIPQAKDPPWTDPDIRQVPGTK